MFKTTFYKLLYFLSIFWGVASLLFIFFRVLTDPSEHLVGQRTDPQTLQNIRHEYHLDLPISMQYFYFFNDLSPIGFLQPHHQPIFTFSSYLTLKMPYLGKSMIYKKEVISLYFKHFSVTFVLATISVLTAFVLGYLTGLLYYFYTYFIKTNYLNIILNLVVATPSFLLSILLLWLFSIKMNLLPSSGFVIQRNPLTLQNEFSLSYFFMPWIAMTLRPFAICTQMLIDTLQELENQDFIRTAKAKGLSRKIIYAKHIFPNLHKTLLNFLLNAWASLLTGAFFIEYIFDYPGIGKLLIESILQKDFPLVNGICLISAFIFIIFNILNELVIHQYQK